MSVLGRRTGAVGISGTTSAEVVASRDRPPHPVAAHLGTLVTGRPSPRVRTSRARTDDGVALVVHTPQVPQPTVLPVLVHLHGGGWVRGEVEPTPWWVAALAEQLPAVVVSVDYRLAPEHPYPAALQDCLGAVRWVGAHPEHVGAQARVQHRRLALVGDSAGANLVAASCLRLRDEPLPSDPEVVHQVLVYPALDATFASPSVDRNAHAPILTRADMQTFLDLYAGPETAAEGAAAGVPRDTPWLSPLHAASLAGLPPATVLTAEHDPLRDDGSRFAARLHAAGVRVRHSDYPGAVHGFLSLAGLERVRSRHAVAEVAAALRPDLLDGSVTG